MLKEIRRLNTRLAALTLGSVCAVLVFLITVVTLLIGTETGARYLMLWSVFLPGYDVSFVGALVGACWGMIWGAVAGALIYRIYDAGWHLEREKQASDTSGPVSPPFVYLDGNALGLGLGIVAGLALFSATTWLVLRGTADASPHAMLLAWYLPGYSVSIAGGFVGGLGMGIGIYLLSRVAALVYNFVLRRRGHHRESA